ncbi:CBM35 domain-containing protein [Isoptericola sp. AK164]|uniref:CBM35 domain-containing protein n=1 Tax=Isoptericola sp. AK164 TaxID=3024246 RepID=UPI0024185A0F|nr:CBM35 domain-containing protein [Isoptericola sp. AK164]
MALRRTTATATAVAMIAGLGAAVGAMPATAAPGTVEVDLTRSTGEIYGGATGVLYGLSDDGVPSDDLIAGQRPRTVAQKAPGGEQHPNGDALEIAAPFFANGGEQVVVYMQDEYSRWPYQEPEDVQADYLPRLRAQVQAVLDSGQDPERFAWVPFNEPDWIWYQDWYGGDREKFFADWDAAYAAIRSVDDDALIVGPNEAHWRPGPVREFLTHAQESGTVPDIMAWHELGTGSLGDGTNGYRTRYQEYRDLEAELGIGPLPINIDEYGNRQDMGNPGRLIQWLSMFEDTKVDADMAFWTYAGNLSDHAVQTSMGNGGWWLNTWYSDLTGHTVELTPEAENTPDTMQGIAALDEARQTATVLLGGNPEGGSLVLHGVDQTIGDEVDVYLETTDFTGQEGETSAPRVDRVQRLDAVGGDVTVTIPGDGEQAAYRVTVVPATSDAVDEPETGWSASYEAEDADLVAAQVYDQAADWDYAASGRQDVGSFNTPESRATFDIEVPADGTYELGILHGSNTQWGQHALYVDGEFRERITYSATLGWSYRGRTEVPVDLTAGAHTISLRASDDDGALDVHYDITLDRIDVAEPEPDTLHFPLWRSRLCGDVSVDHSTAARAVTLAPGASSQTFVGAPEDGYYDLVRTGASDVEGTVQVTASGRDLGAEAGYVPAGAATVTTTVYLHRGVNELVLTNTGDTPVSIDGLSTVRDRDADASTAQVEAEDLVLEGEAAAQESRWASQGTYVDGLGQNGSLVWERPADLGAGEYVLNVAYANAQVNLGHPYNTDVVSRFVDTTEDGGATTRSVYRHNYTWDGFWDVTSGLTLETDGGTLRFGRSDGAAPNIDRLSLSPLTLGTTVDDGAQDGLALEASVQQRCLGGNGFVAVRAVNGEDVPMDVELSTAYGSRTVTDVDPGGNAYRSFPARTGSVPAGEATVTGTATIDGEEVSATEQVPYDAFDCS